MADQLNIQNLVLIGSEQLKALVGDSILAAPLTRTLDGAATLELEVFDPKRTLLKSNIVNSRVVAHVSGRSFELAAINKDADNLRLTFEDLLVAEMKRHTEPRRFAGGTVTRAQAARALLDEIPWARMSVGGKPQLAKVELTRGNYTAVPGTEADPATESTGIDPNYFTSGSTAGRSGGTSRQKPQEVTADDREDTWTAIKRWFEEISWRAYVDDGVLNVGPDSAYIAGTPVYTVRENQGGIDMVNFDWDIGKPMAEADFSARMAEWFSPPGTCVELVDLGPANGKWIVSSITRDLLDPNRCDVKLHFPEPDLPEPDPPPEPSTAEMAGEGSYFGALGPAPTAGGGAGGSGGATGGSRSDAVFAWPVGGRWPVTSGFGPRGSPGGRGSSNHKGIDIGAPAGNPVLASRGGVVTFAGSMSGYGNTVIIDHGRLAGGHHATTLYAHMSRTTVRRGVSVVRGQAVGSVGSTGNSTGPHLHFEIRYNGTHINPLPLLQNGGI